MAASPEDGTAGSRPLIIVNPNSDYGRTAALVAPMQGWLREMGSTAELVETQRAADATKLAADAVVRGYSPLIAVGGDGTVHAVACGLLDCGPGRGVPLGIVPVGSGNDYAHRALNLPRAPREALSVALNGARRSLDAARLNMEWMINSFGLGIDANVAWDVRDMVERGRTPLHGSNLYTFSALKQIFLHYDALPTAEIIVDGQKHPARRMLLTAVMIGPSAGGGYKLTPDADPSDGRLDILMARKMPRPKVLLALQLLRSGRHTWMRECKIMRGRDVRIRVSRPARAHVDGELIMGANFDLKIVPGALTVMVPA